MSDILLVAEIVSPGSEGMDLATKRRECAGAGIAQYRIVERDAPADGDDAPPRR